VTVEIPTQTDRAASMQHDLLKEKLYRMFVTELNKSAIGTVIADQEFTKKEIQVGVMARNLIILDDQVTAVTTTNDH
jgi:hypothetical protein